MAFIADIKVSLYYSQVDVAVTREALSVICHCEKWNWKSGWVSLSCSSRNLLNAFVPGQLVQWCIIHSRFDGSHNTLLTRPLYVTSQFKASTYKMVFWWVVQTHAECIPDEPAMTHHLGQRVQNLENPIFTSGLITILKLRLRSISKRITAGFLSLNATNNSWRLHRTNCFCLWTPFCMLT